MRKDVPYTTPAPTQTPRKKHVLSKIRKGEDGEAQSNSKGIKAQFVRPELASEHQQIPEPDQTS
jgi:hypothetical protein